ncbi:MAG TPA: DUF2842 domain-containing protein [Allosphingosinicella sp.]|nr:DUF2842 domain-containing protein [Allosphingosinicella sp.]
MDRLQLEPRWRNPVGIGLMLLLILVWSVLVVSASSLLGGLPWPVQLIYYAVAGIVWILPLKPLIRWMHTGRWRG